MQRNLLRENPSRKNIDLINADYRYKGFVWEAYRAVWKTSEDDLYNKEAFIRNFERHNEDVRHFFIGRPNFIELDISHEDSYFRLCSFLGKSPLYRSFPHLNKTNQNR